MKRGLISIDSYIYSKAQLGHDDIHKTSEK